MSSQEIGGFRDGSEIQGYSQGSRFFLSFFSSVWCMLAFQTQFCCLIVSRQLLQAPGIPSSYNQLKGKKPGWDCESSSGGKEKSVPLKVLQQSFLYALTGCKTTPRCKGSWESKYLAS